MLAARVEQEAGAGLDHQGQPELLRQRADAGGPGGQVRAEGVQVVVVERERAAVVAEVGDQAQGVVEPVVGEAVGVVAVAQRPSAQALAKRRLSR